MKALLSVATTGALLILAVSCRVDDSATVPSGSFIRFGTGLPTRALLEDLDQEGAQIHVYDILSGSTTETNGTYLNTEIRLSNSEWTYSEPKRWTKDGTHTFFGWMTSDGTLATDNIYGTLSLNEGTLAIPATTLTATTDQVDFLYAQKVSRSSEEADYKQFRAVELRLKHLLSAVSFHIENQSKDRLTDLSFSLDGFKNKNSATLDFENAPVYGTAERDGNFFSTWTQAELAVGSQAEMLPTTLAWPLARTDVAPVSEPTDADIEAGNAHPSSDSLMVLQYKINGGATHTKRLAFPAALEAGKKYDYTILFTDKAIRLIANVLPWDYSEYTMDYADDSFSAEQISFENGIIEGKNVYVREGGTIHASFRAMTPLNGTWRIAMTGDTGYFTISPESGTILGGICTFDIIPDMTKPRTKDCKIKLVITARTTAGRDIFDSEVNRDDWTIILPQ